MMRKRNYDLRETDTPPCVARANIFPINVRTARPKMNSDNTPRHKIKATAIHVLHLHLSVALAHALVYA